jgi:hypothetical protein
LVLNRLLAILLLLCLLLAAFVIPSLIGTARTNQYTTAQRQDFPLATALKHVATAAGLNVSLNYDEMLGLTYTQSPIGSLDFNVTAVEQSFSDSYGAGPGYLVCGLSNMGYWFEAGLAWNWPLGSGGYQSGFSFLYEVFDSEGNSIFPTDGGGGLLNFSAPVNASDSVNLALSFSGGNVTMTGYDWNTKASASESFSAEGATYFSGLPAGVSNNEGFFTGLLTEQYHANPYYGNMEEVTYSESGLAFSSAWMWMDEYNSVSGATVFFDQTISPVSYTNPTQFQSFSSNGVTEYSDAYGFITGPMTGATTTSTTTTPTTTTATATSTATVTSTTIQTSTLTLTTTLPTTVTQTTTATVTQPLTTTLTSTQLTTLTATSTETAPPSTVTSTQTTTQTESVMSSVVRTVQTVPSWSYALILVVLFAGLLIGYVIRRSPIRPPEGASRESAI